MTRIATMTRRKMLWDSTTGSGLATVAAAVSEEPGPATVAHVADFYHRYPGEVVTLYTCVALREPLSDLSLSISLPDGLELGDHRLSTGKTGSNLYVEVDSQGQTLVWPLKGDLPAGARYEYQVEARVRPTAQARLLESKAVVIDGDHTILDEESVTISVWVKGRYLRYLPELYEQDEFMGQFLMFFESFWAPIEKQIDAVHYYLDPQMTPTSFLRWLAGWLGFDLDERLPIERQRQLIRSASSLLRRRGTKRALQEHLEFYTSGPVQIIEHRASDFRLGPGNRLGLGAALGTENRPHSFTVIVRLPSDGSPESADAETDTFGETRRRRLIESIIEAEKPAHTSYTLRIER